MALRYTHDLIQSSHAYTNFMENPQLLAALRNARLPALTGVRDSWEEVLVHLRNMDKDTLERFGALGLETDQKQLGKNAGRNARRREAKAEGKKTEQEINIAKRLTCQYAPQGSFWDDSNQIPSHQPLPVQPFKCPTTVRNLEKATIPHDVRLNEPPVKPGQGFVSPADAPIPSRYQPGQGFILYQGVTAWYQCKPRPKARPIVTQSLPPTSRQSKVSPFAQSQWASSSVFHHRGHPLNRVDKAFRYTRADPTPSALPARLGWWTGFSPPNSQPFSSSSLQFRDLNYGHNKYEFFFNKKHANTDGLIHLPAQKPTEAYSARASIPPTRSPSPQSLLLVLDLNGTLLYRTLGIKNYVPRPGLKEFLDYCFRNHSVLIWSSAKPHNVAGVCEKLLTSAQRKLLLGKWGRDTFGLTPHQYKQRVQVYKNLDTVWQNAALQRRHPNSATGETWGQHNTVLIDDSAIKAAAQPFNHMEVPKFVTAGETDVGKMGVLAVVVAMLEEAREWNDISAFVRRKGDGGVLSKTLQ